MAELEWRNQELTGSQVSAKLSSLPEEFEYAKVYIDKNNLQSTPELNRYKQFKALQVLDLSSNQITTLDPQILPLHLRMLDMSHNNIKEVGDLSKHRKLHKLSLTHNQIKRIVPHKLPAGLRVLDMSSNKITEVCDLGQHKQLHKLSLTHNQIKRIVPHKLPVGLGVLDMSNNKIMEVSDLSKHQKLRKLSLTHNHITRIVPHNLPVGLRVLDVSNNNITEASDLGKHQQLRKLSLSHNHITGIVPQNLPVGLGVLDLSHNNITEVGDLTRHKQLHKLILLGNDMINIHPSNTKLSGWKMDILGKKFFQTEAGYNLLCKCGFDAKGLEQPPPEVFKRGVKSVLSYYKDMRLSKRVRNSRKRLVLLGPTEAGKTSMVESLTVGKAVLVNIRDRTQVINIKYWDITEDDIIHIYDHGGHMIYNITSPLFISKESTIFLVHDISKVERKEVYQTIEVLRQALHQYPENGMYLILTHTDLLNLDGLDRNGNAITKAIQLFLEEEINSLSKLLWSKQSPQEDKVFIDATRKLLDLFSQRKMTMPCYKVSSKNYFGMEEVKTVLVEMARQKRNLVPESWVKFYKAVIEEKKQYLTMNEILALYQSSTFRAESHTSREYSAKSLDQSDLDEETTFQYNTPTSESDTSNEHPDESFDLSDLNGETTFPDNTPASESHTSCENSDESSDQSDLDGETTFQDNTPTSESQTSNEHSDELHSLSDLDGETTFQDNTPASESHTSYESSDQSDLDEESFDHCKFDEETTFQDNTPTSESQTSNEHSDESFSISDLDGETTFQDNTPALESHTSCENSDKSSDISDLDDDKLVKDISDPETDDFSVPLQYFADTNLVLHYGSNPFLKDYVFHDIDFLVELLKSLFHHNISEIVNYETDEELQSMFKKVECDVAVKRYQNEGLLSRKLLCYFWDKYGLKCEDKNVLLELLHVLNICYDITKDEEDNLQYVPWFVQSQKCPPNVNRNQLMIFDKGHSSVQLQCEFFNRIPLNVFEMVCVCLQRKVTKKSHYMGDRRAWHDGLQISFGSVECVLMRSQQNSTIDICLRGKLEDIPDVWKVVDSLLANLMSLLQQYQGIIKSVHFICGHCVILGISPPNCWLPDHVFPRGNKKVARFIQCPKGGAKDIPAALIVAIFKDEDTKEIQSAAIKDIAEYLQINWKSKNPPKELLFLDCEQTQCDVYTLTWALPNVESGGDPVTNVIIEMKGQTDRWQPCQGHQKGNTFTYKGSADEFRVSTQNKHGIGKFSNCAVIADISDEHLSDADLTELNHNMETFCQMSCVEKIALRLLSRGVISQTAQEKVSRCVKASEGARVLIEEIRRCTYSQIFLFKKTLKEFDQPTLAALLTVRKTNGSAFNEESQDSVALNLGLPQPPLENTLHVQNILNRDGNSVYSSAALPSEHISDTGASVTGRTGGCKRETTDSDDDVHHSKRFKSQSPEQSLQEQPGPSRISQSSSRISQSPSPIAQSPSRIVQSPYTLQNELTHEQKCCCPEEKLFGTIVARLQHIHILGTSLGFNLTEIEEFENYRPSSVPIQALKMLVTWRERKGEKATVCRLVKALQKSNIPEEFYKEAVLDYFRDSDSDSDDSA